MTFDTTIGAAFLGGVFTSILYGVTCVQTFIFFRSERKNSPVVNYLIAILWFLDTIHLAFVIHPLYYYMVTNYTNPASLAHIPTIPAGIILTATTDTLVRLFFTFRVWRLSGENRWLTLPLLFSVLMVEVSGIGYGIKALIHPSYHQLGQIAYLLYGAFSFSVLDDFWIAATLCYYLRKSRSGIRTTDSLLSVLMAYTINTGIITTIFELTCFITYAAMPNNYIFLAFYFPLSKLFLNALLASLNARSSLKAAYSTSRQAISIPLTNPNMQFPASHICFHR
ncbi:hypothetical protein C8J56DRAFT_1055403 [Mycena floridula]|nr:hypothetical protein C8J56DRAFT_1055403 [Mycena floridula]